MHRKKIRLDNQINRLDKHIDKWIDKCMGADKIRSGRQIKNIIEWQVDRQIERFIKMTEWLIHWQVGQIDRQIKYI